MNIQSGVDEDYICWNIANSEISFTQEKVGNAHFYEFVFNSRYTQFIII